MKKNKTWILYITLPLTFIVSMICLTLIILNNHPYPIRIEMDNNTKEAVMSLDNRYSNQIDYNNDKYLNYFNNSTNKFYSICGNKTYKTIDNKYCNASQEDMIQCFRCD